MHDVVPLALLQLVPHAPQLVTVVLRFVSQPLFLLPSQLPKPALHTGAQMPAAHDVDPFALTQAVAQLPQLPRLVWVFTSQPLLGFPSQLA